MGTIVQPYGPIYGEAVNGTVQGRPNGSVYVPISNIMTLDISDSSTVKIAGGGLQIGVYSPNYSVVAVSQDLGSYIQRQVYSDAECTTLIAVSNMTAGIFNVSTQWYAALLDPDNPPSVGDTVYFRAQLMNNGVAVATSSVISKEVSS